MAKAAKKDPALTPEEKLAQALVPESEQPYRIPENWCWTKIGVLSSLHRGVSYKKDDAHADKQENDCLVMRGGNIGEGYIDVDAENVYVDLSLVNKDQLVKKNDIIIVASTGSTKVIGRAGISFDDYSDVAFGAFLMAVRPSEKAIPRYMDFYFQSDLYRDRIRDLASGVNINNIRSDYITESPYPLPPLAEQQRIVDRIESLFAKLDEAKEKAQAVVDGFEDRKAAILYKAFTGELTESWRSANMHSRTEWKHKRFSELCDIVRGGSPRPAGDPKYYDGNIPFMKVADITSINGPYVSSATYSIKEAGLKKTRMVEANTLLLTNSGATLGVPAICTFQTTFNDGIAAFLNLDPEALLFFYYFWSSKTRELRAINMGAAQPNLNTSIIGAVEIDVPPVEEQKEIVRILEGALEKESQVKDIAEQVVNQIDAMKKSILARAFRGELGTNDPTEESAEELLKRIL